jgi:hypothetical protein
MPERPREELGVVETSFGLVEERVAGSVQEGGFYPESIKVKTADGRVKEYAIRGDQDVAKGDLVGIVATTYPFSGVPRITYNLISVSKRSQPVQA